MGALAAYLLASDISYTGVIPQATPDEVGRAIYRIKRGSYNQMMEMGLIDLESDEQDCGIAYTRLYEALNRVLTEEEKQVMMIDVYSPEYVLCKMFRLKTYLIVHM
jgi:hypothetical protein